MYTEKKEHRPKEKKNCSNSKEKYKLKVAKRNCVNQVFRSYSILCRCVSYEEPWNDAPKIGIYTDHLLPCLSSTLCSVQYFQRLIYRNSALLLLKYVYISVQLPRQILCLFDDYEIATKAICAFVNLKYGKSRGSYVHFAVVDVYKIHRTRHTNTTKMACANLSRHNVEEMLVDIQYILLISR